MKITVFYVLAPLRRAESDINARYEFGLQVATYNCGASLTEAEWRAAESDIAGSELVFVIHVTEGENARRISAALDRYRARHSAVVAFNCMPDLMRRTRMGKLEFARLMKSAADERDGDERSSGPSIARKLGTWMADFVRGRSASASDGGSTRRAGAPPNSDLYLKLIGRLPAILKFVPGAGKLRDIKNYLLLFCYFLQPTPKNICSMLLYAIKRYAIGDYRRIKIEPPEAMPVVAIYHPDAPKLFETFGAYKKWYERKGRRTLNPEETVGLLLMRPQIVSDARRHYDGLIRAIEREGLSVIPAISTFMDNRDACRQFFVEQVDPRSVAVSDPAMRAQSAAKLGRAEPADERRAREGVKSRVSQIVSLTGFSFVGGPAMNDSEAAASF